MKSQSLWMVRLYLVFGILLLSSTAALLPPETSGAEEDEGAQPRPSTTTTTTTLQPPPPSSSNMNGSGPAAAVPLQLEEDAASEEGEDKDKDMYKDNREERNERVAALRDKSESLISLLHKGTTPPIQKCHICSPCSDGTLLTEAMAVPCKGSLFPICSSVEPPMDDKPCLILEGEYKEKDSPRYYYKPLCTITFSKFGVLRRGCTTAQFPEDVSFGKVRTRGQAREEDSFQGKCGEFKRPSGIEDFITCYCKGKACNSAHRKRGAGAGLITTVILLITTTNHLHF